MKKKKMKNWKKILIGFVSVILVLVLVVVGLFVVKRPGAETDDMLFDAGMFNPISLFAFSGDAYASSVVGSDDTYNVPAMLNISFKPSVRTQWHTHDAGQLLICTYGQGFYQVEGETAQILREGDVVLIPADVEHWHGAGPDGWFSHIVVETNPGSNGNNFLEPISDEEYAFAVSEGIEFSERSDLGYSDEALADLSDGSIFAIGDVYDFDGNGEGVSYKNQLIAYDEEFHFPDTYNITFEAGAHSNYHANSGGQIIVSLGGEGYYRTEDGEKITLKPTDVAHIEPGVYVDFGALDGGWFNCLVIDANTPVSTVTWK